MLTVLMVILVCLGALVPRVRLDSGSAVWFQMASYRHGTVSHLVPMLDGDHTEDEVGDCPCGPRPGAYPMGNGSTGILFLHRPPPTATATDRCHHDAWLHKRR